MKTKVAIVGAGATGRGFIARLLDMDGAQICFVDENETLIRQMNEAGTYQIFVGKNRVAHTMKDYEAYHIQDPAAVQQVAQADYVFVSVGEQNLGSLGSFFSNVAAICQCCRVIVCENGISPKLVLRNALSDAELKKLLITQGVIFCTTIPYQGINILSEDYEKMPYDFDEELFTLPFSHFTAKKRFDILLKRKIYTYNCLSACIAYIGYMKGYSDYGAAANDEQVIEVCDVLHPQLTRAISKVFDVPYAEQEEFGRMARRKFTDTTISDTITKNARSAERKISPNERLVGPINMFLQVGEDIHILCFVAACALVYMRAEEQEIMKSEGFIHPMNVFLCYNPNIAAEAVAAIYHYFEQILGDEPFDVQLRKLIDGARY